MELFKICIAYQQQQMLTKIILALLCLYSASSIQLTCNQQNQCPSNSACGSNNYCYCEQGFIGDCNTTAISLGDETISFDLIKDEQILFYITPIEVKQFLQFTFNVCQQQQILPLVVSFWGEQGSNSQYLNTNTLIPATTTVLDKGCASMTTSLITFGTQPNGQKQMLIMGVFDASVSTTISISVNQRVFIQIYIYYYIMLGFGGLITVLILASTIAFTLRRRIRAHTLASAAEPIALTNNIDYFDVVIPAYQAQKMSHENGTCPICLQQIEERELVRKTPCNHIFHNMCIDCWCAKILNCPVCRSDLSRQAIVNRPSQNIGREKGNSKKGYQVNWQQSGLQQDIQYQIDQPNRQIRQSML